MTLDTGRPARLLQVQQCMNLDCDEDAVVVVASLIALCGPHALEWYRTECAPS